MNTLLQCVHLYGLIPLCIRSCFSRLPSSVNALLQYAHLTPLCIRSCVFRLPCCVNALLQYVHLYGFTPVCMRSCLFRLPLCLNAFLQCVHVNGGCLVVADVSLSCGVLGSGSSFVPVKQLPSSNGFSSSKKIGVWHKGQ